MRWVRSNGVFIKLDDFYDSITYIKSSDRCPEWGHRPAAPLQLWKKAGVQKEKDWDP